MKNNIKFLIIHHTAVSRTKNANQFEAVLNYHISKGWGDIGYHYLMEADGMLMRGRHESEVGAHCKEENMNYQSLGLCLTGNFDVEEPTKKQLNTLRELITYLRNKYDISRQNVKFHRDFATYKTCPGRLFTNKILNKCMSMRELKRDKKGGFWFIKSGDKGKQKVNSIGGVLTVLSREFGVDTIDDTYLEELQDKKYFN